MCVGCGSIMQGTTGRHHMTLCPNTLQAVATGGVNPPESFLTVLDVECIDAKVGNTPDRSDTSPFHDLDPLGEEADPWFII